MRRTLALDAERPAALGSLSAGAALAGGRLPHSPGRGSDQGYTGARAAEAARAHSIELEVVKLPEAKRGFVLLPRRWAVERPFA